MFRTSLAAGLRKTLTDICVNPASPSLPLSLTELYAKPVIGRLLGFLKHFSYVGRDASASIIALTHLAKHCSQAWNYEELETAVLQLKRLMQNTDPVSLDANLPLSCLAALIAIPLSRPLQDTVVEDVFVSYVLQERHFPRSVKRCAIAVIGAVGTTDRNPVQDRDHLAAWNREERQSLRLGFFYFILLHVGDDTLMEMSLLVVQTCMMKGFVDVSEPPSFETKRVHGPSTISCRSFQIRY